MLGDWLVLTLLMAVVFFALQEVAGSLLRITMLLKNVL